MTGLFDSQNSGVYCSKSLAVFALRKNEKGAFIESTIVDIQYRIFLVRTNNRPVW
jgi:hypothetical protein